MVFYFKTKLTKCNNNFYINAFNVNVKVDKVFINDIDENEEKEYYFYRHQEINFKNKFVSQIYCFNSEFDLNFFLYIINVTSVGISSIENIFKVGAAEFLEDMKSIAPQTLKIKYQLRENQVTNIYKQFKLSGPVGKVDKKKDEMINNLVSLGFNKTQVQPIINRDYEIFKNKEMDFVIRKFVEILKSES